MPSERALTSIEEAHVAGLASLGHTSSFGTLATTRIDDLRVTDIEIFADGFESGDTSQWSGSGSPFTPLAKVASPGSSWRKSTARGNGRSPRAESTTRRRGRRTDSG